MADINYNDHASKAAPTADDFVPIWDVAASQSKKATIASLFNARLTGGGIIATGGFTLTVPATGTAALLGTANTFTAPQSITPSSAASIALLIDHPAGPTADSISMRQTGTVFLRLLPPNLSMSFVTINPFDGGPGVGPNLLVGHNNNGSTPSAGWLNMRDRAGGVRSIWVDNTGLVRTSNTGPLNATDTSGTVVGTQSSALAAKDVLGPPVTPGEALAHLHHAAKTALRRFKYKLGQYNGEEFEGLVVDYASRYGMDAGRSLNLPTLFSDLIQAVTMLAERVEHLEAGQ